MSSLCAGEEQLVGRRVTLARIHRAANRQAPPDLIQYLTQLYQASEGGSEQERIPADRLRRLPVAHRGMLAM